MNNFFKKISSFVKKSYWVFQGNLRFGESAYQPTKRDYLDSYEMCFLVFTCIRKIAEKVANAEFKLYKILGTPGKEKIDEVKNHPLLDLLAQVNPFTTKFEMMDITQTYIELLGNAYWYKARGKNSRKPLELWMLRPDRVEVIEDPDKIIKEYRYTLPNGTKQNFAPEDIIHFKQPNPKSAFYGLPTVAPIMEIVENLVYSIRWNKNFFYNNAIPDTVILTKNKMSAEEKEEFRKNWQKKYGGISKSHSFGILEGEDVKIEKITDSMKDMQFTQLEENSAQQILAGFGVPKSIIGMQGMNRAEAEAQIYTFLSETIEPKVRRIIERLNEFLVPEYGDNLYLDFEKMAPQDRRSLLDEYEIGLRMNWLLINEVRDREGLPPIEGGWDFYLPITSTPAGGATEQKMIKTGGIESKNYYKNKKEKEQEFLRKKVLAGKRKLKLEMQLKEELRSLFIRHKKEFTPEAKRKYWEEHDKILSGDEKLFAALTRRLLKSQEKRIQDELKSQFTGKTFTKGKYDLINWDLEDRIFVEVSTPIFTNITERRGKRAAKLVGTEDFTLTNRVKKFIDKKTFKFANEINETTKDKLKDVLSEGVDEEEGIDELSKRVADVFKIRKGMETERIARTEVLSTSNEATIEAYVQSDVVEKKEWLATMDDRVRDSHAEMNGKVVELDERFSNGLLFPGDPMGDPEEIINCRCTILPVIET